MYRLPHFLRYISETKKRGGEEMSKAKRKICLSLVLLSIFLFGNSVHATSLIEIGHSLRWINTDRSSVRLNISHSKAVCSGYIKGASNTSKISAEIFLEKKNGSTWSLVKKWSKSVESNAVSFNQSISVNKGYAYRAHLKVTTVTNGKSETSHLYSRSVSY